MAKTVSLSFRVDEEKGRQLEKLAEVTDRPRSWLLEQALDSYLEVQAWQIERIKQGLADLEAGRLLSHAEVSVRAKRRLSRRLKAAQR